MNTLTFKFEGGVQAEQEVTIAAIRAAIADDLEFLEALAIRADLRGESDAGEKARQETYAAIGFRITNMLDETCEPV